MSFNQSLFEIIFSVSGHYPILDAFGVFLAEYLPYFLLIGAGIFIQSYKTRRQQIAVFAFIAFTLAVSWGVIAKLIRFVTDIPRPFTVLEIEPLISRLGSGAFPSDHTTFFFALGFAIWALNRRWGTWYLGGATLVGLSRIFVGVHWPLDVLGGFLTALIGFLIARLLFHDYLEKILHPPLGPELKSEMIPESATEGEPQL